MNCENIFCIYQKDGICKLEKVDIDVAGMCSQCIYVDMDNELLTTKKDDMRKRLL